MRLAACEVLDTLTLLRDLKRGHFPVTLAAQNWLVPRCIVFLETKRNDTTRNALSTLVPGGGRRSELGVCGMGFLW